MGCGSRHVRRSSCSSRLAQPRWPRCSVIAASCPTARSWSWPAAATWIPRSTSNSCRAGRPRDHQADKRLLCSAGAPLSSTAMHSRDSQFTLLEATRVVARGSELDSKLDALCGYVVNSGASEAIVYLFDPVNQVLVPAAHAGIDPARFAGNGSVSADDPDELI